MEAVLQASWDYFVYSEYIYKGRTEKLDFRNRFLFSGRKKKTVNILKGCQLQSGLFQDFKSKGSFWISLLMLYAAQGLRWAAESEAARVKGGSHFLPQNGSWFFVFFFLSHQRASK